MQALTLAKQRLRARIQNPSTPEPLRLAHGFAEKGGGRYLPVLSSATAQDLLQFGYSARTLDRIYRNQPAGDVGPVGFLADRSVLALPIHEGFRERLQATIGEGVAAAVLALRNGEPEFRAVFAPCGLGAEILGMAERLRERDPNLLANVRCWGVDPDSDGHLLPEARKRLRDAGIQATFLREDLRRHRDVSEVVHHEGPFHLVSLVGASQLFGVDELSRVIRHYVSLLAPGGTLLIDRWQPTEQPRFSSALGAKIRTQSAAEFTAAIRRSGLAIEREHPTGEGGCVLVVARKPQTA